MNFLKEQTGVSTADICTIPRAITLLCSSYQCWWKLALSGVTRGGRGADRSGDDSLQGMTTEGKKLWANLQRTVEKRGWRGKKGAG